MSNKKENTDENKELIQWHTGFVHAMRLYLMDYEDDIEFNDEFQLTRKPLIIDLTVVKKPDDLVIDNNIGRFFRKHNILEYKSPRDELNLETFYKVQAYALLYMIAPGNCEANGTPINEKDITISIVRAAYPRIYFMIFCLTSKIWIQDMACSQTRYHPSYPMLTRKRMKHGRSVMLL